MKRRWIVVSAGAVFAIGFACARKDSASGNFGALVVALALIACSLWYVVDQVRRSDREAAARRKAIEEAERVRQEAIAEAKRKLDKARADQQAFLRETHEKYQQALAALETKPTDMELRKAALVAGRTYADVARIASGQRGRTMFDEAEIQNDIAIRIGNSQVVAAANRSHKCPNCAAPLVHEAKVCRFCDATVHA